MRVLKFGGSSLATPDRIGAVGRIVANTVNGAPAHALRSGGIRSANRHSTGSRRVIVPRSTVFWAAGSAAGSVLSSTNSSASCATHGVRGGAENEPYANRESALLFSIVLAMDPRTPTILYAGIAGGGVFKTTDGGLTWSAIDSGLRSLVILALAVDPLTPTTGTAVGVFDLRQQ
jgi:hypothetical protein